MDSDVSKYDISYLCLQGFFCPRGVVMATWLGLWSWQQVQVANGSTQPKGQFTSMPFHCTPSAAEVMDMGSME